MAYLYQFEHVDTDWIHTSLRSQPDAQAADLS